MGNHWDAVAYDAGVVGVRLSIGINAYLSLQTEAQIEMALATHRGRLMPASALRATFSTQALGSQAPPRGRPSPPKLSVRKRAPPAQELLRLLQASLVWGEFGAGKV
jgi:hypothetical protein